MGFYLTNGEAQILAGGLGILIGLVLVDIYLRFKYRNT